MDMKHRYSALSPDADQKQNELFDSWFKAEDIPFIDEKAKESYRKRVTLIRDAIEFKKIPQRIPICPSPGFFPVEYGGITMYDAMYDYTALKIAWERYHHDFRPDAYTAPTSIVPGKVMDILDLKLYQWPGKSDSQIREYQFVEGEYMKAEEYQELIDDPTAFFLSRYFPRIFKSLGSFTGLPLFPPVNEMPVIPMAFALFGGNDIQSALSATALAGNEAVKWRTVVGKINSTVMGLGFPSFSGGFTKAPFDVIGDSLRGTTGVMLDMYRYPEELKEACERLVPIMVKAGVNGCRASSHIMPFIPLHKGADGFMSDSQFQSFYWPTLRKLIIGLVNEGLVPQLFAEGSYTRRLDIISDIPKGKTLWWFDRTDMKKARETVGKVSCIAGNVPLHLLCTGTTEEVTAYCRTLIDTVGRDGGYIFSTGAGMQGSKTENVKTMMDVARQNSTYR